MKVGIVVPYSWSYRGGVIEHAERQAAALRGLGVETRLICGHDPPSRLWRAGNPRRDSPPADLIPIGRSVVVPTNGSLANAVLNPAAWSRLRRTLEREGFDLLHLHEPAMPVACMAALALADVPLVGTFHASGAVPLLALAKSAYGFLIGRLDRRLAVSPAARETAERFFPGHYEIVPNGAPLPVRTGSRARANQIVFIGRHDRRKGLAVLLRAWPRIRQQTGARLRLVGADPAACRRLQARLSGSKDGVDLLGQLSDRELTRELTRAKALVAPSLGNESFGMVITRAFGCATPVVASDIAGYRDVVTPQVGLLVAPGDHERLAQAVIELVGDESRRSAAGAAARLLAERSYSWQGIASRLLTIYDDLTGLGEPDEMVAA